MRKNMVKLQENKDKLKNKYVKKETVGERRRWKGSGQEKF
jgi:hypothetical protein